MASGPSASWNSRSTTHLACCPSLTLPMNFPDESYSNGNESSWRVGFHYLGATKCQVCGLDFLNLPHAAASRGTYPATLSLPRSNPDNDRLTRRNTRHRRRHLQESGSGCPKLNLDDSGDGARRGGCR